MTAFEFELPTYHAPDFNDPKYVAAPNAQLTTVEMDGVAPENFHSTSMYPEYFKIDGEWHLAPESRMDASVVVRKADDGTITVTGNSCPRGELFAQQELTAPKRTICSTVATTFPDTPVLPVRVSTDIPKDRIFDVMNAINDVCVTTPVKRNDVLIRDVLGTGADVIVTSDLLTTEHA